MISHLELFAGIGGFRKAIELLSKDFSIKEKCVGFSEIDPYAALTYKSNFNIKDEIEIGDINQFTSNIKNIKSLEDFVLLTGGFPCQSFSMMGKKKGFDDHRGNVFYRIIDILKIKKPPFVLLENVKNLKTHNNGDTFKEVKASLYKIGYKYIYSDIFNSSNFNLAQNRNRIFIFASTIKLPTNFIFSQFEVMTAFHSIRKKKSILHQETVIDVLNKTVDRKYYLSEKIKPTILANGSKGFLSNSEINQLTARPLTATMVKMHRACQDNYYSDKFINSKNPLVYNTARYSKDELASQSLRKITPEEAFNLQGFDKTFFKKAIKAGLSDHQMYKQSGNAVSVNTVYAIVYYLFVKNNILDLL
jgi:DNA (cytosine-5)-methyltransferase 1